METVDIIASGYEWVCPCCNTLNRLIECPDEQVMCQQCSKIFDASPLED